MTNRAEVTRDAQAFMVDPNSAGARRRTEIPFITDDELEQDDGDEPEGMGDDCA